MSITKRLSALESAAPTTHLARGFRIFERIGDTDEHIETTKNVFDHSFDIQGGRIPDFVHRWSSAELDALGADGWQCIVVVRVAASAMPTDADTSAQPETPTVSDKDS